MCRVYRSQCMSVFVCVLEYSYRTCGSDGQWQGKHAGDGGWTNYTDCYTAESKAVFHMLFEHISPQVAYS